MSEFSPLSALAGGVLIGVAVSMLWVFNGRLAGISTVFGDALVPRLPDVQWRWTFLAGLIAGGLLLGAVRPLSFAGGVEGSLLTLAAAGLLVGVGTRLGGGCTSGHGVCGMARLSVRSMVSVAVFMVVAGLVVYVSRHLLQGGV
jgi:hypothetical protein